MLQVDRKCSNFTDAEFFEPWLATAAIKVRNTVNPYSNIEDSWSARKINRMVKKGVIGLLAVMAGGLALGFLALFVLAPSLNWSAAATPSAIEKNLAGLVLHRWVRRHAAVQNNPLPASEQNLKTGQREFGEHCAVCHGPDGSAHDLIGADFYPPIARLQKGAPGWSDGELFFIIANGIRYTGMPGFGAHHGAATIWQIILWVRHLPHLSAAEKAQIQDRGGVVIEHEDGGAHTD